MTMPPGTIIDDRFEIIEALGQGAFGTVYKSRQINFERHVALKVLNSAVVDRDTSARLLREAQALSSMQHRNLTSFYGYGVWNHAAYIAMEYIEGTSLQDLLKANQPIPARQVVEIFQQICDGLSSAHLHGIIHRDLKPSNVILSKQIDGSELVKVIDFGLARVLPESGLIQQQLTDMGQAVGTVHYMSPEQCLGNPVNHRSDIYAVGCMFFQCLTGRLLFDGDAAVAIMFMHLRDTPDGIKAAIPCDAGLQSDLQEALQRCLEKNPDDRYESIGDFKKHLERISKRLQKQDKLTFEPQRQVIPASGSTPATGVETRSVASNKKLRWVAGAAAVAAACMVIGSFFSPTVMVSLAGGALHAAPSLGVSTSCTSPLFHWCMDSAARSDNPDSDRLLQILYEASEKEPLSKDNYAVKVHLASIWMNRLDNREQRNKSLAIQFATYRDLIGLADRLGQSMQEQSAVFDAICLFCDKHSHSLAAQSRFEIGNILATSGHNAAASKWYQRALQRSDTTSDQIPSQLIARGQLAANFARQNDLKASSDHILQMLQLLAGHSKKDNKISSTVLDNIECGILAFISSLSRPVSVQQHQQMQSIASRLAPIADAPSKLDFRLRMNSMLVMTLRADGKLKESAVRLRLMEQLMDDGGLWSNRAWRERLANEQFWTFIYADEAKQTDARDSVFADQLKSTSEVARCLALVTMARIDEKGHRYSPMREKLDKALALTQSYPASFETQDLARIHQMIGEYLCDTGDPSAAITSLFKSVALCNTGQSALLAHIALGRSYEKLRQYDKADTQFLAAAQYLNEAGLLYPESYFDHYRDVLVAQGKGDMRIHVDNWQKMASDQRRLQD